MYLYSRHCALRAFPGRLITTLVPTRHLAFTVHIYYQLPVAQRQCIYRGGVGTHACLVEPLCRSLFPRLVTTMRVAIQILTHCFAGKAHTRLVARFQRAGQGGVELISPARSETRISSVGERIVTMPGYEERAGFGQGDFGVLQSEALHESSLDLVVGHALVSRGLWVAEKTEQCL